MNRKWINPVERCLSIFSSSPKNVKFTSLNQLTDRCFHSTLHTVGNPPFVIFDLGSQHALICTKYMIRHDSRTSDYLRNWKLEATNEPQYPQSNTFCTNPKLDAAINSSSNHPSVIIGPNNVNNNNNSNNGSSPSSSNGGLTLSIPNSSVLAVEPLSSPATPNSAGGASGWTVLDERLNEKKISHAGAYASFAVRAQNSTPFRYFRITMTGPTSSNGKYTMVMSSFELYGLFLEK